jgi:hypothetical protein
MQHHYAREKQQNSLVNVAGNPRVRTTIVEDIAVGTNFATTNILAEIMRKDPAR